MKKVSTKLYAVALGLTALIFIAAILTSFYINARKTTALKSEEDAIAINILSLESQSDILTAHVTGINAAGPDSKNVITNAITTAAGIAANLDDLQSKLDFMQNQLGSDNPDVFRLKRYYSLLEIKDYVLEQALVKNSPAEKTATSTPLFILYFYGGAGQDCPTCLAQQYILEAIQQKYPWAHVYSFDYSADLAAIESFIPLRNLPATPPVVIINGTTYPGFADLSDAEAAIQKALK
jgi:hypothetical protein